LLLKPDAYASFSRNPPAKRDAAKNNGAVALARDHHNFAGEFLSLSVFIVEDLDSTRELLIDVFQSDDRFRVVATAVSEGEAKIWLEDHLAGWDIALVDLMLAEGSGFGVINRARQTHSTGCIAVFTSFASQAVEKHCISLGADVVFDKAQTTEFLRWLHQVASAHA
jgi:two-component system, OmpR family, response regulator